MKTLLILCLALAGFAGLTSTAEAQVAPAAAQVAAMPSVVHINQALIVETNRGHRYRHRHHYHRRYYYRHHRRYYY